MAALNTQVGIFRLCKDYFMPFYFDSHGLKLIEQAPQLDLEKIQDFIVNFTFSNRFAPACCNIIPQNLPRPLEVLVLTPSKLYYPATIRSNQDLEVTASWKPVNLTLELGWANKELTVFMAKTIAKDNNYIPAIWMTIPIDHEISGS